MFDFYHPSGIHSRLLTLMLAVDLFCSEAFIRLCIRVTNPNVEKGRAFSGGSRPSDKGGGGGGGGPKKIFFGPLGLILVENKGGTGPAGPSPGSATGLATPSTSVNVEPGIRCSVPTRCQHLSVYLLRCWLNLAVSTYHL